MTLGKKLQALRKDQKLSQEELAARIMVSRQAVSKWESDESIPDIENLLQLSKLFKVSLDYLLNDEVEIGQEAPTVVSAVRKEMRRRVVISFFIILFSVITALYLGLRYHVAGLVTGYLILSVLIFLFVLLVVLVIKAIRFLERNK